MQRCTDCKSTHLREDYSDGSLVCTNCGLIASHFLIDDRPVMDECRLVHYETQNSLSDKILCMYQDYIPITTLQAAETACMELTSHKYDVMVVRAACVYHAWKKTKAGGQICHLDDLCRLFHVSKSKVIDVYRRHFVQDEMPNATCKYNGFAFLVSNDRIRCKVMLACSKLESFLATHPNTANKKPTKMCAAIFFWCCVQNAIHDVPVSKLCEYAQVSTTTFKKHLKIIECVQNL